MKSIDYLRQWFSDTKHVGWERKSDENDGGGEVSGEGRKSWKETRETWHQDLLDFLPLFFTLLEGQTRLFFLLVMQHEKSGALTCMSLWTIQLFSTALLLLFPDFFPGSKCEESTIIYSSHFRDASVAWKDWIKAFGNSSIIMKISR